MVTPITELPLNIKLQIPAYQAFCKTLMGVQTSANSEKAENAVSDGARAMIRAFPRYGSMIHGAYGRNNSELLTASYQFAVAKLARQELEKHGRSELLEYADFAIGAAREKFTFVMKAELCLKSERVMDTVDNLAGDLTAAFEDRLDRSLGIKRAAVIR